MTTPSKPKLHNGYKVSDVSVVDIRVERSFYVEVYRLTNQSHLYLFTNIDPNGPFNPKYKDGLVTIKVGAETFVGLILKDHSRDQLLKVIQELTTLRGFDAVAGMEDLKEMLRKEVIAPLHNPEKFKKYRITVPNGILLFGPPGCGKTFIVRKLAEELNYSFIEVKHSDLASPFIHETVAKIGQYFAKARASAPSIVFIDEMSGLVPKRDLISGGGHHKEEEVNEFLIQLDGASEKGVLVVGATNYPDRIDSAVLRSGRMDKRIFVPPPDAEARSSMFRLHLMNRPIAQEIDYGQLSKLTENFVSSDIELIVTNAARHALSQDQPISTFVLLREIKAFTPSVEPEALKRFTELAHLERW